MLKSYIYIVTSLYLILVNYSCNITTEIFQVTDVKTTYVSKGPLDNYELSVDLVNTKFIITDSFMLINELMKDNPDNIINEEFGDTIYFERVMEIQKKTKSDGYNQYPYEDLSSCINDANVKNCVINQTFFELIRADGLTTMNATISKQGKYGQYCVLFDLGKKRKVLYFENDFLLLDLRILNRKHR